MAKTVLTDKMAKTVLTDKMAKTVLTGKTALTESPLIKFGSITETLGPKLTS